MSVDPCADGRLILELADEAVEANRISEGQLMQIALSVKNFGSGKSPEESKEEGVLEHVARAVMDNPLAITLGVHVKGFKGAYMARLVEQGRAELPRSSYSMWLDELVASYLDSQMLDDNDEASDEGFRARLASLLEACDEGNRLLKAIRKHLVNIPLPVHELFHELADGAPRFDPRALLADHASWLRRSLRACPPFVNIILLASRNAGRGVKVSTARALRAVARSLARSDWHRKAL